MSTDSQPPYHAPAGMCWHLVRGAWRLGHAYPGHDDAEPCEPNPPPLLWDDRPGASDR